MSGFVAKANRGVRPNHAVRLADLAEQRLDLARQLVRADVQVRVVLDELADPGEARQRPGALVPVEPPELAEAQRQVAVRAQVRAVDVGRFRAVHRLEAEGLVLGLDQEHVVAVQVPMARLLPQPFADHDRRRDLLVAAPLLELAHRALERAPDPLALGVPERGARRDVVEREQVELDAEPAVVALLGLGASPQVGVEVLLGRPGRAVDALEHRSLLVAAPVGAGRAEQLERADLAGARDVRAAAQVDERALAVERRRRHRRPVALGGRGEVVDDLDLERLVPLDEERAGVGRRELAELERVVGGDALAHPRLDRRQVVGRERARQQEVVVEAVGDDRADPELRAGKQVEDRLGQHVRRRVPHRPELVAARTVIHELGRAAALGRLEQLVRFGDRFVVGHVHLLRNHETPRPLAGREVAPAVPPAFTVPVAGHGALVVALSGDTRIGSPIAHRWCHPGRPSSLQPGLDSLGIGWIGWCVLLDAAIDIDGGWWATLDSNQ